MKAIDRGDVIKIRVRNGARVDTLRATVVTAEGADPKKPIGVVVKNPAGRENFVWVSELDIGADYYIATYFVPRIGMFTKIFDELEDFDPSYAPDRLVELRRYYFDGTGWGVEVL